VERTVGEVERERVAAAELDARSEARGALARELEVRLVHVGADQRGAGELVGEAPGDLARPPAALEPACAPRPGRGAEDAALLRPDRLGLRREVAHHRLVRHLLRLRVALVLHRAVILPGASRRLACRLRASPWSALRQETPRAARENAPARRAYAYRSGGCY